MQAALRGKYMECVIFRGFNETYPHWFAEEIYCNAFFDDSRFTTWRFKEERSVDYHDKQLVDDNSVFLRKPNGDIFVTDIYLLTEWYTVFCWNNDLNFGVVAYDEDCIEFVECRGGHMHDDYPEWFYEYFTEAVNFPHAETIYFNKRPRNSISNKKPFIDISNEETLVDDHCVFLRNKFGEIKGMGYDVFLKYYDPNPTMEDY